MSEEDSAPGKGSDLERSSGILIFRVNNGRREYLFLNRPQGFLDNTKGHIENGENEIEAARRETREECGLSPELVEGFRKDMEYRYRRNGKEIQKRVTMFLGEVPADSNVRISEEHTGYVWLSYEEAMRNLTFENQTQILMQAEKFLSGR
jgi:DNA polymerase